MAFDVVKDKGGSITVEIWGLLILQKGPNWKHIPRLNQDQIIFF